MFIDLVMPSSHLNLLFPSSPAFSLSQHQGLFQRVRSLHQAAEALQLQLQHQSFQWIFRIDFLKDLLVWSPCCPRDSQESSPTPQFKSISSSVLSLMFQLSHLGIFYYKIVVFVFNSWNSSRTIRWKECAAIPNKPFNHTWVYLNKMTFGKSLRMGTDCQENQPWLEGWNFLVWLYIHGALETEWAVLAVMSLGIRHLNSLEFFVFIHKI